MRDECPFCVAEPERVRLENEVGQALRDLFPVTAGHTLVVPRRHVASLFDLSPEEQRQLWELTRRTRELLQTELQPDGYTIGLNEGMAAGQSVPHAHIHVIPRRHGDVSDPTGGIRAIFPLKAHYWGAG